jgi:molybdopterin-biosynthesis enzyme MoeA-like protein
VSQDNGVVSRAFGLIVIGDEVLVGGRSDKHFGHFKALLSGRGHTLAWYWMLPDDPPVIIEHLRFSPMPGVQTATPGTPAA